MRARLSFLLAVGALVVSRAGAADPPPKEERENRARLSRMKPLLATFGFATVLLGACAAHENLARPECAACHRRCDDELRECRATHDAECDDRRRGCEDRCHVTDECR